MNPILYTDLFDTNVKEGIKALSDAIASFRTDTEAALDAVKKKATEMGSALRGVTTATTEGQKQTKSAASTAESLAAAYAKLTEQEKLAVDMARELASAEKDKQTIDKMTTKMANEQETSYNRLSATYSTMKVAINAMTEEQRKNDPVCKQMVENAKNIYEQMNKMQQATGKYQLQVGNYTKAMGGLNLSMAQVVREVPTLGNSLNQFAVAISNNVPILMDNIQRYTAANKEAKEKLAELMQTMSKTEAMKAMGAEAQNLTSIWGALGKSLLSMNTIIVAAMLAFELIAKAIDKKRRAQKEANAVTKDAVTALSLLQKAYIDIEKEIVKSISKLQTLYGVTQDVNRSLNERRAAAEVLKQDFEENFKNFSEEEIALGKAKVAYDELTASLTLQAKARAYLNKITELQEKWIDQKAIVDAATADRDAAQASQEAADAALKHQVELGNTGQGLSLFSQRLNSATKRTEQATTKATEATTALNEIDAAIRKLQSEIPVAGLLTEDAGDTTRNTLAKIKDYYWEWRESIARIIIDEEERELAISDVSFEKRIDALQDALEEQKKAGNLSVENEKYIQDIITNLVTEKAQQRNDIILKYYDKLSKEISEKYGASVAEEIIDEEDLSVSGQYEKLLAPIANALVKTRASINEELAEGNEKEVRREAADFKALMVEKLTIERSLQEALLKMRLETGNLTAEQYDIEMQKIAQSFDKNIDKMSGKRGRKQSIWSLFFGSTKVDEYGNVTKELSQEQEYAIQSFQNVLSKSMEYMDEWMDKRIEMAEVAVEAAQKESEAAKTALDYEMEARANGYANNVELARKEYEEKLAIENEAVEEKEKLQRIQENIDTAQQVSSLITATAQLLAAYANIPFGGQVLSAAAIAAMWASFAAAKITAAQVTSKTYGEGGMEYINYGGSHASGNDVDFGRTKDGRPRRIERGEVVGVINKKNVSKYGVSTIKDIISSINRGTFEEDYSSSTNSTKFRLIDTTKSSERASSIAEMLRSIEKTSENGIFSQNSEIMTSLVNNITKDAIMTKYGLAFAGTAEAERQMADLGTLERGVGSLIEQGRRRVIVAGDKTIEYNGNLKRTTRI